MFGDLHQPDEISTVNFDTLVINLDSEYGTKYQNWHLEYDSSLSLNTKVN